MRRVVRPTSRDQGFRRNSRPPTTNRPSFSPRSTEFVSVYELDSNTDASDTDTDKDEEEKGSSNKRNNGKDRLFGSDRRSGTKRDISYIDDDTSSSDSDSKANQRQLRRRLLDD